MIPTDEKTLTMLMNSQSIEDGAALREANLSLVRSVSLVNKAVVDYFFVELGVEGHFEALRHFLLMEDGEFAQSLSDLLFEKVRLGPCLRSVGPCDLAATAAAAVGEAAAVVCGRFLGGVSVSLE